MMVLADKRDSENAANTNKKTRRIALTGMLFATALVLSLIEGMLPPLPIPVPGVKIGLPNIVVMYALFLLDKKTAVAIAVLKAAFVGFVRGTIAGILSLCGGLLSVLVMAILIMTLKNGSYLIISVFGAISHNMGQYIAVCILYSNINLWLYIPVLVLAGIVSGILTAALLRLVLPALKNFARLK